jgi:hypothetical protein
MSTVFDNLAKTLGYKVNHISAMHPQANAKSERSLQTVMAVLRAMVKDVTCWELSLPMVQLAINQTVQPAINVSAHFALFGQHPHTIVDNLTTEDVAGCQEESLEKLEKLEKLEIENLNVLPKNPSQVNLPFDVMETALPSDPIVFAKQIESEMKVLRQAISKNKTESAEVYRKAYNKRTHAEANEYPIGSLVLIKSPPRDSKLKPKYEGPFIVLKIAQFAPEAPRTYLVQNLKTGKVHSGLVSGDRLQKFYVRNNIDIPELAQSTDSPQSDRREEKAKPKADGHHANGRRPVKALTGRHNVRYNANYSDQKYVHANDRNNRLTGPSDRTTGMKVVRQNAEMARQNHAYNNGQNRQIRPVQTCMFVNSLRTKPFVRMGRGFT